MKALYPVVVSLLAATSFAAHAQNSAEEGANYQLLINGKSHSLEAGKPLTYKTASGEILQMELRESSVRVFRDEWVSFQTPRNVSVSETAVDEDVRQIMAMNALGAGMLIQEYGSVDPSSIIDFMLIQLTKEGVAAGAKRRDTPFSLKLADGKVLKGKTVELTVKKTSAIYKVVAWSGDGEGLLIVLLSSQDGSKEDADSQKFQDRMVASLRIVR
ncbi:MAG: hypothetical protein H7Z21_15535 [Hymenobacter sp.]|nr:hypothetical protein [Hymenobacter sp.]